MKRWLIVIACLGLLLSACSSGRSIGQNLKGFKGLSSIPTSTSPTPTAKKPTHKPTPKPTVSQIPMRKGNVWTITVHSVNNGYEPNTLRAVAGDTVIFKNLDTATPSGHTFTGDNNEWSSGVIKPGMSWTWKINLKPGLYHWHDEQVPYLVGGPLQVLAG